VLPLILIDATPLRADSGRRGIGRYVRELLHGLVETRDDWRRELRVEAVEDLSVAGGCLVASDLAGVAERAFAARGTRQRGMGLARRFSLGRVASERGAALLHLTEPLGTPLSCPVPCLLTCHDLIALRFPEQYLGGAVARALGRRRERRRYARAGHVVAISETSARDARRHAGAREVSVIPHGIDLRRFELLPAVGSERPFVLYVGGSDYRKNVEGMLGALALARSSVDVELAWAGWLKPAHARQVRAMARAAGVERHVRLLGFVSDEELVALYRRAAAHLFLSRLEGFGLTVVEAMAAGCPVIVARGSSSDELAGPAGVVVDADDRVAAGAAIVSLIRDHRLRSELAAQGRERARHFERRRMARDYAALYAELCRR